MLRRFKPRGLRCCQVWCLWLKHSRNSNESSWSCSSMFMLILKRAGLCERSVFSSRSAQGGIHFITILRVLFQREGSGTLLIFTMTVSARFVGWYFLGETVLKLESVCRADRSRLSDGFWMWQQLRRVARFVFENTWAVYSSHVRGHKVHVDVTRRFGAGSGSLCRWSDVTCWYLRNKITPRM